MTVASPPTVLLVSSGLSDSSWPRYATALPSVFKLSMVLVDSSSRLGLLGIGLMLTSCQSAGGEQESGLDWEKRVKTRGVMRRGGQFLDSFLPRLMHTNTQAHTHLAELIWGFFLGLPPKHSYCVSQRAKCSFLKLLLSTHFQVAFKTSWLVVKYIMTQIFWHVI